MYGIIEAYTGDKEMTISKIKIGKNVKVQATAGGVWYVLSSEQARKNLIRWFGDIKVEKISKYGYVAS